MKTIVLLLVCICLCLANQPNEPSAQNTIESKSGNLQQKNEENSERIFSGFLDENIQENDYMPDALKELIAKKMAEMPEEEMGTNRIFGGQIAPRGAYPHQVGMSLMFGGGQTSWCGGSIVSAVHVVTAAHCLDNVMMATLIVGGHDRINGGEAGRVTQTVTRNNFIVHPGWNPQTMLNDIALIRLNQKLQFSNLIQPITISTNPYESFEGQSATVSGWGHYDASKQLSRYLRHAQSTVANNALCKQFFGQFITNNNVCLDGSRGQGACNGDSGGPMIARKSNGQMVLIGLTSFGSGQGCDRRWPTVYTKLAAFSSWIKQNTGINFY